MRRGDADLDNRQEPRDGRRRLDERHGASRGAAIYLIAFQGILLPQCVRDVVAERGVSGVHRLRWPVGGPTWLHHAVRGRTGR